MGAQGGREGQGEAKLVVQVRTSSKYIWPDWLRSIYWPLNYHRIVLCLDIWEDKQFAATKVIAE